MCGCFVQVKEEERRKEEDKRRAEEARRVRRSGQYLKEPLLGSTGYGLAAAFSMQRDAPDPEVPDWVLDGAIKFRRGDAAAIIEAADRAHMPGELEGTGTSSGIPIATRGDIEDMKVTSLP
jgi:hypothetical protein